MQTTDFEHWDGAPEKKHFGGYITGFVGALLGAVVGCIPWFFASTFVGFYIGWLGFLVGWVSLWGYKALRGVKKSGYATVVIFAASILSMVLADLCSNLYNLLRDTEFIEFVETYGLPKIDFALSLVFIPENVKHILPNLGLGLLIGVLGVVSARKQILAYTAPAQVVQAPEASTAFVSGAEGFSLPHSFVVREGSILLVVGIVTTAFFSFAFVFSLLAALADGDPPMYIPPLFLVFILLGVTCILQYKRRKLAVTGESLLYSDFLGRQKELQSSDIAYITLRAANRLSVYGHDGKALFKMESNMMNFPLFTQYLANRNVALRG